MGLLRLVFFIALIAAIAWSLRDVLKRLGGWVDDGPAPPERPRAPKLVAIERTAWDVLGLEPEASRFEIEASYRKMLTENAPERVSDLSPQLQELAERLCEDATKAYQELIGPEE
ncbi:MAG: J domain-containing protein [Oligoflexia bacterium]|nr:J domain-containing protein [Oligoflexia bacterium]